MGSHGNPSCNYNSIQTRCYDQNIWYSLHIYNSLCFEQLYTSCYQLPNHEPQKGTVSLLYRLIREFEENWNLPFWMIKAKLHGLKSQTFVCLLKLFAAKVIFCIPFEISVWQHPIPKRDLFTTLLMF